MTREYPVEMVEVFKTNVQQPKQAQLLVMILSKTFPSLKINFDLDDCDRILRVEGQNVSPQKITEVLSSNNYQCQVLE